MSNSFLDGIKDMPIQVQVRYVMAHVKAMTPAQANAFFHEDAVRDWISANAAAINAHKPIPKSHGGTGV